MPSGDSAPAGTRWRFERSSNLPVFWSRLQAQNGADRPVPFGVWRVLLLDLAEWHLDVSSPRIQVIVVLPELLTARDDVGRQLPSGSTCDRWSARRASDGRISCEQSEVVLACASSALVLGESDLSLRVPESGDHCTGGCFGRTGEEAETGRRDCVKLCGPAACPSGRVSVGPRRPAGDMRESLRGYDASCGASPGMAGGEPRRRHGAPSGAPAPARRRARPHGGCESTPVPLAPTASAPH